MPKLSSILAASLCAAHLFSQSAFAAEDYPQHRPITFIVGFGPGGSTDIIARLLAPKLKDQLGQTVVVDNKPGASGSLAAESLVRAPADGYTIMACTSSILTTHKYLFKNLRFDAAKDILPVSQISSLPYILLAPRSFPANTVAQVIDLVRQKPGEFMYGSSGIGSAGHLAAEMFSSKVGIRMNHVPYKGSGQAMTDLVAGRISLAFDQEATVSAFLSSGHLKAIAIASSERSTTLPQVPTFTELGIPFEAASWTGICVRRGTPKPIVDKISEAVKQIMVQPDVKKRFIQLGMTPRSSTSEEFQSFINDESERLGKAITALGIIMAE